jgi:hydrogenase nickel incorporation protein HypA/HybF
MHEMSLAEGMLAIVEDAARASAATRVTNVRLAIGALSHVERDALAFCFDAVTRGSVAEGATLTIDAVDGAAWCMPCGATVALARIGDPCPRCGSFQLTVTAGDDMRVKDIEVA